MLTVKRLTTTRRSPSGCEGTVMRASPATSPGHASGLSSEGCCRTPTSASSAVGAAEAAVRDRLSGLHARIGSMRPDSTSGIALQAPGRAPRGPPDSGRAAHPVHDGDPGRHRRGARRPHRGAAGDRGGPRRARPHSGGHRARPHSGGHPPGLLAYSRYDGREPGLIADAVQRAGRVKAAAVPRPARPTSAACRPTATTSRRSSPRGHEDPHAVGNPPLLDPGGLPGLASPGQAHGARGAPARLLADGGGPTCAT